MKNTADNLAGKTLGTSVLQKPIGQGGMGAVYLAKQRRPSRFVAIKVLLPNITPNSSLYHQFLTRFRREADVIARLEQINIIPIYEYGEQDGMAYLVMPYLPGGSLRDVLAQNGTLSLPKVVAFINQAAAALDYAHAQGVIHRDLKPGNFLLSTDGRLVLADFGIAHMIQESDSTLRAALTATGMLLGTPGYMAPEMLSGEAVDHRADIYALGIVLFQMLSGDVPFKGNTPFAVAAKHLQEPPPSLHHMSLTIPPALDSIIQKALAKKREDRFASAGEMAYVLQNAVADAGYLSETQERNAPTRISPPRVMPVPIDQTVHTSSGLSVPIRGRSELSSGKLLSGRFTQPVMPYPASGNRLQPWLFFIGILLVLIVLIGGMLVGLQLNKGTNGTASSLSAITTVNTSHSTAPPVGTQSIATSPARSAPAPTARPQPTSVPPATLVPAPTARPQPTATSTPTPTATAVTQNPSGYPSIIGNYSGPIHNTRVDKYSTMALSINQNLNSINGQFTLAWPWQGDGPFTGSIDTSNNIQFTVFSTDTSIAPILFWGIVQPDGSLSGSYCSLIQGSQSQCDTGAGHGTWTVTSQ